MMDVADARTRIHSRKSEPRTNRAVGMESPFAHVAIPRGLHLAHEHGFLVLNINRRAEEVSRVRACIQDCLSRSRAQPKTGCNIRSVGLNHPFFILPVPERPQAPSGLERVGSYLTLRIG